MSYRLAIIGMTDQLIHERVDSERYHDQVAAFCAGVYESCLLAGADVYDRSEQ